MYAFKIENLNKKYPSFTLDNVSFSLEPGYIMGFIGRNGAGKTTTMRMITGFLVPTEGKILIDDIDVTENPVEAKKKIGYMPESAPLYSDMIVEEYLEYIAQMHGQNPKERIPALCKECGLKEVMDKVKDMGLKFRDED